MEESFEIPLHFKGQEILLPARFIRTGYSYKIEVDMGGGTVRFEPDEERAWRAVVDADAGGMKDMDRSLLQSIAEALDAISR